MTDDPIHALERELLAAARRATHGTPDRAGAVGSARLMRRPLRRALLSVGVIVPVLVVLAVALAVRSGSGSSHTPGVPSPLGAAPSSVLSVLRRPGIAPHGQALSSVSGSPSRSAVRPLPCSAPACARSR